MRLIPFTRFNVLYLLTHKPARLRAANLLKYCYVPCALAFYGVKKCVDTYHFLLLCSLVARYLPRLHGHPIPAKSLRCSQQQRERWPSLWMVDIHMRCRKVSARRLMVLQDSPQQIHRLNLPYWLPRRQAPPSRLSLLDVQVVTHGLG